MEISINKKASNYFFIYSSAAPTGKKLNFIMKEHHTIEYLKNISMLILLDDILEGTFVDFVNANDSIKNYAEKREKICQRSRKIFRKF